MSSEAEAQKLLNEFEYNQQRNLLVQTIKIMLSEFLEHWMEKYVKYTVKRQPLKDIRILSSLSLACFSSSVSSRLRGFPDAWLLVSCKPKIPFS